MRIVNLSPGELTVDLESTPSAQRLDILDVLDVRKTDPHWLSLLTCQESILTVPFPHLLEGGGFVRVTTTSDFLAPYLELLAKRTGGQIDRVTLSSITQWTHTHLMESCEYYDGLVHATMVVKVYRPTNCTHMTDEELNAKALKLALRYLQEDLGETIVPQEFILAHNNCYKPNPEYGGRALRIVPRATNEKIWQELFGTWATTMATPAQQAMLKRFSQVAGVTDRWPSIRDHQLYLDQYATVLTWDALKTGTIPPIPEPA